VGAEVGGALAEAFAAGQLRQAGVAPAAALLAVADRLVLGGPRFLQLAQLLGPLGGDRRGGLLALDVALRRRARPIA
jgi:hypothetical protein